MVTALSCALRASSSGPAGRPRLRLPDDDSELGCSRDGGGGVCRPLLATPSAACAAAAATEGGRVGAGRGSAVPGASGTDDNEEGAARAVKTLALRGGGYGSPRASAACLLSSASALVGRPRFFFGGSAGSLVLVKGAPSGLGWITRPL